MFHHSPPFLINKNKKIKQRKSTIQTGNKISAKNTNPKNT